MKKIFTPFKKIIVLSSFLSPCMLFAQNELAIYNFNGTGQETCTNRIVAPESPVTNLTFSNFTAANLSCVATANQFNNDSWNTTAAVDVTEYVEFSISGTSGYTFDLDSLYFDIRSSQTGGHLHMRSSLDNYANDIASFSYYDGIGWTPVSSIDVPDAYLTFKKEFNANYDDLGMVTFRFYATDVSAGTTTIRFDNVIPYGSVNQTNLSLVEKETAAYSLSPNPGDENLVIQTKSASSDLNIRIFTSKGKLVRHDQATGTNAHTVDMSGLESGVYFVQLSGTEGQSTYRWIKK